MPEVDTINDGANVLILDFYPTSLLIYLYHTLLLNHLQEIGQDTQSCPLGRTGHWDKECVENVTR